MGSDDIFKKKRAERKARKHEIRTVYPNSYLIVSEGEKTEPYYFEGLARYIKSRFDGTIDVEVPKIKTVGCGMCTVSLVEEAARIVNRSVKMYQHVWLVFDKDDFEDFDKAVQMAGEYGFHCAWSNQCFEYWLYLHFHFSDAALHRSRWMDKLDTLFYELGIGSGYEKNREDVFEIVTSNGSLKAAVGNGKRIESRYGTEKASECDPCTTVHRLILQLKPFLGELFS